MNKLDGNAMAGDLVEVFGFDVTAARYTCAGCGEGEPIGALMLWGQQMGRVARCPHCDDVVLRLVWADDRVFLDLRGAVRLELPLAGS